MNKVIEYRCLDCGKHFPYGVLVKQGLNTCPVCGYELVPVSEAERSNVYDTPTVATEIGVTASAARLIGVFVAVSGLIFALAVLMPK